MATYRLPTLVLLLLPVGLPAQTPAERYEPVFEQLRHLAPRGDRLAVVHDLTLRRDVIKFHLEDGWISLATPVAGRTVAAVFVGHGSVSFVPPSVVERAQVKRVLGDSVIDSRITAAAFVFTDSTLAELEHHLTFNEASMPPGLAGPLGDLLDHLIDGRMRLVTQPTLMAALLNARENGFFYGHVKREHGEDVMLMVDPMDEEPVELLRGGKERGEKFQVVSEVRREEDRADTTTVAAGQREPFTRPRASSFSFLGGFDVEFSARAN